MKYGGVVALLHLYRSNRFRRCGSCVVMVAAHTNQNIVHLHFLDVMLQLSF